MFDHKLFGVPWVVVALGAMIVAAVYLVWDLAGSASGWRWFVLRWAHGACWVLLAMAALTQARTSALPVQWGQPLGVAGAICYLAYLATHLTSR